MMRVFATLVGIAVLGLGVAACAKSGGSAQAGLSSPPGSDTPTTATAPTVQQARAYSILNYGREASATELRAVAALLERYYTVAANDDGAAACPMLVPSVANSLAEDFGDTVDLPFLRGGKTCKAILTKMFAHRHALLAVEHAGFDLYSLRVHRSGGYAILRFPNMTEREILVGREKGSWKLDAMVDIPLYSGPKTDSNMIIPK